MAKQRRRRRRHRNRHRSKSARFVEYTSRKNMEAALGELAYKEEQSKYQEVVAKLEADILARTVFVTNVLDLNRAENLARLKSFLERTYGSVEKCERASHGSAREKSNRPRYYPPARVRFTSKSTAELIFQGTSLVNAKAIAVSCPDVGVRGAIRIQPSKSYSGMADEELKGDLIQVEVQKLTLGHWCPKQLDTYVQFSSESQDFARNEDTDEFVEELTVEPDDEGPIHMSFDLRKRRVEIASQEAGSAIDRILDVLNVILPGATTTVDGPSQVPALGNGHVISFRFKELRRHMEVFAEHNILVFALKWPPKLYRSVRDIFGHLQRSRDTAFLNLKGEDFGNCLSFQVQLSQSSMEKIFYHTALSKLRKFGVFANDFDVPDKSLNIQRRNFFCDRQILRSRFESDMSCVRSSCHPEIGFLLKALVDNGRSDWYHMYHDTVQSKLPSGEVRRFNLPQVLQRDYSSSPEVAAIAIQTLERILDIQGGCTVFPCKLFFLLSSAEKPSDSGGLDSPSIGAIPIPEYYVRVPRLLLSPCGVRVVDVGTEIGNRVVRRFTAEENLGPCSFLRLQLGDETGKQLFSDFSPAVCTHIKSTILNGIEVNGRKYCFMAYSSSQLKECSLWMVSCQKSSVELRAVLGNFSDSHTVSKWAARIGQCLSTTVDCAERTSLMKSPAIVPDIKSKLGMEHSDGTGVIMRPLFDRVCKKIPFAPTDPKDISILQIRFGGAKGTISAWEVNERLAQAELRRCRQDIILRESMKKFDSKFDGIEVCSVGMTVPYYLNRFVILLLSAHGIPDSTFLSMQNDIINKLDAMLSKPDVALQMLPSLSGPNSTLVSSLLHMLSSGLSPATEPFLFNALHAMRQHHLFNLRKKARIFVEKGAVLMGGLDESGLLKEGEIFVQMSKKDANGKLVHEVIIGPVMVTKHPAMHMGDHGDRPEADKMSGSDLDGDQFAVTWDERLFLSRGNHDPLDFSPADSSGSVLMPTDVRQHDNALVEHFVNHMINDNLGRIAMLWLDYASRFGSDCEKCVQLAKLHSIAVDFPKSGVPAVLPKELLLPPDFKIGHWREVKQKDSVPCESIIGQLYDQVIGRDKDRKIFCDNVAVAGRKVDTYGRVLSFFKSHSEAQKAWQKTFRPNLPLMLGLHALNTDESETYTEEANYLLHQYEEEVRTLMNKYHLYSEGELFTGCIRKYHKLNKKKQHSIAEEVRRSCRTLRQEYRKLFFESVLHFVGPPSGPNPHVAGVGAKDIEEIEDEAVIRIEEVSTCHNLDVVDGLNEWEMSARMTAFRLAGAIYVTAYAPSQTVNRKSALFSFPWLFADVIHAGMKCVPRQATSEL